MPGVASRQITTLSLSTLSLSLLHPSLYSIPLSTPSLSLLHPSLRQVRSAVTLSREASGRVLVETVLGEELVALQEADSGVQRLGRGEPWAGERSALWLGVQSLAFTLVTEPHENLLLAEGTLKNITRHCLEHLRMLGMGSEVLLKSDRIDVLLHRLLPHGQLLFLNHRFTQSLEKELANYMAQ
ncbi:unnamed protein product [Oncorhynchus mykiss]|uniref:AP-5 complex subunit sigma-1 n=1 Tax=Oncorhynchus mykiss TaxID=8022 RepID=A0A060YQD3_ONCMY|nr:unnamed protein product [Oncorhynchus mykiss]